MAKHLKEGNIVRIICNSSKRALRILNGNVDGNGGLGEYARFIVHVRSSGVIVLQNYKERGNYLAINKGKLIGTGRGGAFCELRIHNSNLGNGMISLESVKCPSQFVGILPNGSTKLPNNTKKGPHGSFSVELVQSAAPAPSPHGCPPPQPQQPPQPQCTQQPPHPPQPAYPPQQPPHPPQPAYPPQQPPHPPQPAYPPQQPPHPPQPAYPPQQPLQPAEPPQQPPQPAYPPQQPHPHQQLAYPPQPLQPSQQPPYTHQPDFSTQPAYPPPVAVVQPPLGTFQAPQQPDYDPPPAYVPPEQDFPPEEVSDSKPPLPPQSSGGYEAPTYPSQPSAPPAPTMGEYRGPRKGRSQAALSLQHGFIVCLQNACTGHFLCIEDNGTVCGTGADDDLTDFVVVTRGLGVVSFQLANDQERWLGIYNGVLTRGGGHFPQCAFNVVDSNQGDNYVSFESVAHPGQHIGVRPGGDPKPPANTGRGPEGSFCPVYVDERPMFSNLGLKSKAYWRLNHGSVVVLTSRAHNKNLRIHLNGRVDCEGGWGEWTKFIVETRGNGVVALRSWKTQKWYLNISNDRVGSGTGGEWCNFIPEDPSDYPQGGQDSICFSFACHRSQHIGVLPNGDLKSASHTHTGPHGQFTVVPCDIVPY